MTASESRPRLRWQVGMLVSAVWLGLVVGTVVGGRFFVPEGSGLAGPAIALGDGLGGMLGGLVLAVGMAWKAPYGVLRGSSLVAMGAGLVLLALAVAGVLGQRAERRAKHGLDVPLPPASALEVEATQAASEPMRRYRRMEVNGEEWRASWVVVGPGAETLAGRLTAAEAEALLAAVAALEARWAEGPPLCPEVGESGPQVYRWRPATGGDWRQVAADEPCVQREKSLGELRHRLGRLPLDMVSRGGADIE